MEKQNTPVIDLASGLMLLVLAAIWGGSFFFAQVAVAEVPPLTITLHRVVWATLALFVYIRVRKIALPRGWRIWRAYLVMGGLNNAIPFSLIFWGQSLIGTGLASILNGTTAVFGAVVAGILLVDEPLTARKILGAVFGVIGVAVIMGLEALVNLDLRSLAQLAILGAAVSYALASVWGKTRLRGQRPEMNAFGMLIGAVVWMVPVVLIVDGVPSFELSFGVWSSLVALAVVSTSFAYLLYFAILARAGAANLMLVTLMVPPFAIALGVAFLGEQLKLEAWLGFALIGIGLIITDGRLWARLRG